MGYVGQVARMPLNIAGFQHSRNTDLLMPTALVDPTSNVNFHEGGLGKRGGTAHYLGSALTGTPELRGLYQFRLRNGNSFIVFGDSGGNLYYNSESNVLKTGLSTSNRFHMMAFDDEMYLCDGATIPQTWDGSAGSTSDITGVPTDWAIYGYPFQAIAHSRGSNQRVWYITKYAVYGSKSGDGKDASDAEVKKIPIYSDESLVGGCDFGGIIFIFTRTKTYLIDDSNTDASYWGYQEAIWEGGVAHWRLITKAGNNLYLMTEEGLIYSLRGVQSTGDYESVALTRPAHIDRWFDEKVTLSNMENFHSSYDRTRRAISYFVQSSGSDTNTAMNFFIDRPPEVAWIPHNNPNYSSGYNASVSAEIRVGTGEYTIYTGDFSGMIWKLEQTTKADNSQAYKGTFKTKPMDMGNPRIKKHFKRGHLRVKSAGNFELAVRVWVDGVRKEDKSLSLYGSGATFGSAVFGTDVFASESIIPADFDLNYYGYDIQLEIYNEEANEDFFASELMVDFKPLGIMTP